ncbi:hypothetical protein LN042_03895 [Kitasatospora sp. RB6PN24]|uniref:hypothetical protein n=1 Tax=Kitasatospora humi TaxID=2893891 RepID=UPI001E58D599|nr:hypothetical protein [Kitasatospora humi]MCC9306259.1 hypothetical protein [Kitasatospora humi]
MSVPAEPFGAFGPAHVAAARLIPADAVPVTDENAENAAPAGADTGATEDGGVRALLLRLRAAAAEAPSDEVAGQVLELVAREMTSLLGRYDREALITWRERACRQDAAGNPGAAVHLLGQVVAEMAQHLGPTDPETLVTHLELATAIGNNGDPRAAVQRFQELLPALTAAHGAQDARVLTVQVRMAANLARAGEVFPAAQQLQTLIPWIQQSLPTGHPLLGEARCALARLVPTFRRLTGTPDSAGLGPVEAVAMVHRLLVWDFGSDAEAKACVKDLSKFTGKRSIADRLASIPDDLSPEQAAGLLLA